MAVILEIWGTVNRDAMLPRRPQNRTSFGGVWRVGSSYWFAQWQVGFVSVGDMLAQLNQILGQGLLTQRFYFIWQ